MNENKGLGAPPASRDRAGRPSGQAAEGRLEQSRPSTGAGAFTPGPWGVSNGDLVRVNAVQATSNPVVICGVHRIGRYVGKERKGEVLANARLIAAAPDLYRALRDLLELVRAHGLEPCGDLPAHEFEAIVDGAVQDAARALAKVQP